MSDLHEVATDKMREIAAKYNMGEDNSMREITPDEFEKMSKGQSIPSNNNAMNNIENRNAINPEVQESPIFVSRESILNATNLPPMQAPILPSDITAPVNQYSQNYNTPSNIASTSETQEDEDDDMTDASLPEPIPERKPFAKKADTEITKAEVIQLLKDIEPTEADRQASNIVKEINDYRKKMIINNGFTPEEADKAARNRLLHKTTQANTEWTEQHPPKVDVTISKESFDKVKFTKDEKEKLTYAKRIRLIEVENKDLENIKIKSIPKTSIPQTLKRIEGSISRYSGPLPITGDYITVNGAQTMYLVSAVYSKDDTIVDAIRKKATLAYDKFMDGTILHKQSETGKTLMSYTDFIDTVSYYDLDMIVYYVYLASSLEESSNVLPCGKCGTEYDIIFNTRSLLRMDNISDHLKENIEFILENKEDSAALEEHRLSEAGIIRLKSNFTNNIYDIDRTVTISKAISVFGVLNMNDQYASYISPLVLHLHRAMILDPEDNQYINIAPSKSQEDTNKDYVNTLISAVKMIPEEDIKLINAYLRKYVYIPQFRIESKCPACGYNNTEDLYINTLVFLKAQDTEVQIEE